MPHIAGQFNRSGPLVDVLLGVSAPYARALKRAGKEPPPRVRLTMLVDTGCDTTLVAEQYLRSLQLEPIGQRDIQTATTDIDPASCNAYAIAFRLHTYGDAPFELPALEVVTRPLFNLPLDGLIGRDVLQHLVLRLDGPQGRYRIDY